MTALACAAAAPRAGRRPIGLLAARDCAREAQDVARRTGDQDDIDYALANYLVASWQTGDMATTGSALPDALDTTSSPYSRAVLLGIQTWYADATGAPMPERGDDRNPNADHQILRAWQAYADLTRALVGGDAVAAAVIAAECIVHVVASNGIDDDFCVIWPPLVLAALAAHDIDLAQQLLQPVEVARPGRLSPAVAAQWHRLRGLVAAARGGDPVFAETEMRLGLDALDALGAHG